MHEDCRIGAVIAALAASLSAAAQCPITVLEKAVGDPEDYFGLDIALDGGRALVGVPGDDQFASDAGAALLFRDVNGEWMTDEIIAPDDLTAGSAFGLSVDMAGDLAVVGAGLQDGAALGTGAVYVFRFDGTSWVEEAKLTSPEPVAGERFGHSLDLCGGTLVIGAPLRTIDGMEERGAAYVFTNESTGWQFGSMLTVDDGLAHDLFGGDVACAGNWILVGAPGANQVASRAGNAYLFHREGESWIRVQALNEAPDSFNYFGTSVDITSEWAVVGEPWGPFLGERALKGAAHVFRFDGSAWTPHQVLFNATGETDDEFGQTVTVDGQRLAVGSTQAGLDFGSDKLGALYLYVFAGAQWVERARLSLEDVARPQDSSKFGRAVGLHGNLLAGTETWNDGRGGSALLYSLDETDSDGDGLPDACESMGDVNNDLRVDVLDLLAVLTSWGECDACPGDFSNDGRVDVLDLLIVLAHWGP